MSRYEVGGESPYYWVKDNKSDDEIMDYYNVTKEINGLECDGMSDKCEEGECQHIKAVQRYLSKLLIQQ